MPRGLPRFQGTSFWVLGATRLAATGTGETAGGEPGSLVKTDRGLAPEDRYPLRQLPSVDMSESKACAIHRGPPMPGFPRFETAIAGADCKQKFAVGAEFQTGCEQKLALRGKAHVLASNALGVVIALEPAHDEMSAGHSLEMVDEQRVDQCAARSAEHRNRLRGCFL